MKASMSIACRWQLDKSLTFTVILCSRYHKSVIRKVSAESPCHRHPAALIMGWWQCWLLPPGVTAAPHCYHWIQQHRRQGRSCFRAGSWPRALLFKHKVRCLIKLPILIIQYTLYWCTRVHRNTFENLVEGGQNQSKLNARHRATVRQERHWVFTRPPGRPH